MCENIYTPHTTETHTIGSTKGFVISRLLYINRLHIEQNNYANNMPVRSFKAHRGEKIIQMTD